MNFMDIFQDLQISSTFRDQQRLPWSAHGIWAMVAILIPIDETIALCQYGSLSSKSMTKSQCLMAINQTFELFTTFGFNVFFFCPVANFIAPRQAEHCHCASQVPPRNLSRSLSLGMGQLSGDPHRMEPQFVSQVGS